MRKEIITYTDFNGVERTEEHYFNISKSEIADMEMSEKGGYSEMLKRLVQAEDRPALSKIFREFILKAYGVKSIDGRSFDKSDEISTAFSHTGAYDALYIRLLSDTQYAIDFVNSVFPSDIQKKLAESSAT
jgi:hypothetical protein